MAKTPPLLGRCFTWRSPSRTGRGNGELLARPSSAEAVLPRSLPAQGLELEPQRTPGAGHGQRHGQRHRREHEVSKAKRVPRSSLVHPADRHLFSPLGWLVGRTDGYGRAAEGHSLLLRRASFRGAEAGGAGRQTHKPLDR